MRENINGKTLIFLDTNIKVKILKWNPINNNLIDKRYISNKMETTKRCYRCLYLQERNLGLKRELKERKDHYKANVCAGIDNKSLIAQKRVIKDTEYIIEKIQRK